MSAATVITPALLLRSMLKVNTMPWSVAADTMMSSRAFGCARPATGFSLDLRKLAAGLAPAERARTVCAVGSGTCVGRGGSPFAPDG